MTTITAAQSALDRAVFRGHATDQLTAAVAAHRVTDYVTDLLIQLSICQTDCARIMEQRDEARAVARVLQGRLNTLGLVP